MGDLAFLISKSTQGFVRDLLSGGCPRFFFLWRFTEWWVSPLFALWRFTEWWVSPLFAFCGDLPSGGCPRFSAFCFLWRFTEWWVSPLFLFYPLFVSEVPIALVIGQDSANHLDQWHRWQDLFELALTSSLWSARGRDMLTVVFSPGR
jgi:hypothetical protein